ncbi:beta-galactosidase [bacterium]|nr:beta-galactosidase [bacterium]
MYRFFATFVALCGVCTCAYGADVNLASIGVQSAKANANLISNGSFELPNGKGLAKWWNWGTRWSADTTCTLDETTAVSGFASLKITNNTPLESPYTGLLSYGKTVAVEPGKPYTLSAWVKSECPGVSSICAGMGWRYRVTLQSTGGIWRPFSMTFTPDNADKGNLGIYVQSESPTSGLWLDDFKLEQSDHATYDQVPNGTAYILQLWPESRDMELLTDGSFSVPFLLNVTRSINAVLEASISKKSIKKSVRLEPGLVQIMVGGTSSSAKYTPRVVTLRILDGDTELASAGTTVRFYSQSYTRAGLQRLEQVLPSLMTKLEQLKTQGQDISYPMVSYTVLENFIGYAKEDVDKNEVKRASEALFDMDSIEQKLDKEISEALSGKRALACVPRWTGDARPVIKSSSFIAPTVTPGKSGREMRPVFFTGYGHFGQVRADMEKWPNYGTNIIQIEVGPSSTLPEENKVNDQPARDLLTLLDRAQKSGVCVNLLLSPHYLPGWVKDKMQSNSKNAWMHYINRDPVCREMIKRHVGALIPFIKDHPALHSICVANEPTSYGDNSEYANADWHVWLKDRHGDIKTLNDRWGTDYACFEDIKLPYAPCETEKNPMGRWLDCVRWNQEFVASWYQMLADAVHEIAPNLPVHMKIQTPTLLGYADPQSGNDPYLIGQVNDINGNDSVNWPSFGGGEFAQSWMTNARGEDLQRSVKDAPVFDSENHIIGDRDTRYIPGSVVRAALWQQAIHGQSATTIWVWERIYDRTHDFAASIMHRPGCAEAVGITNCDLNRAADEVTALQQAPTQVLILHDTSAMVYDGEPYDTCSKKAYMALGFCGVKIGYITERQLEAGIVPTAQVVMIPYAKHLSDAAYQTLQAYRGRIVILGGDDTLAYNEYDKKRSSSLDAQRIAYIPSVTSERDLHARFLSQLSEWGIAPRIMLVDDKSDPVWGVEWKEVATAGGILVNLCNYLNEPVSLGLSDKGKSIGAVDVLSGAEVSGTIKLQPLEIKLLRVNPNYACRAYFGSGPRIIHVSRE